MSLPPAVAAFKTVRVAYAVRLLSADGTVLATAARRVRLPRLK
ncbi:MAG: hypothetical protein WKF94_02665 [Solirubrobacteraceae bacterium]